MYTCKTFHPNLKVIINGKKKRLYALFPIHIKHREKEDKSYK